MIYNNSLFKNRVPILNKALDAYALRQQTISKNIANATSPHYRPEEVRFEEYFHTPELAISGVQSEDTHIPIGAPQVNGIEAGKDEAPVPRPEVYFSGETHVNIDKEMSELAQNQIKFRFASRAMKNYFTGMMSAITGYKQ